MELIRLTESAGSFPTVSLRNPVKVSKAIKGDFYDLVLSAGGDDFQAKVTMSLSGSGRQRGMSSFMGSLMEIEAHTSHEGSGDGSEYWTRYVIDVYNYETSKRVVWSKSTRLNGDGCGEDADRYLNRLISDIASRVDLDDEDATLHFMRKGFTRLARRDLPGSDILRWRL